MSDPGVASSFQSARDALDALIADPSSADRVERVARVLSACFGSGGKVLACGNGGSACDAMHLCEELTGRFRADRPPLPAVACVDPGHITCTANDFGFDQVFSRWVRALGRPGDVLVVLSTSGNSPNVVRAVECANARGLTSLGLLGRDGGTLKGKCDHEWIVPARTSERIQEIHMLILHCLVEAVERIMFPEGAVSS